MKLSFNQNMTEPKLNDKKLAKTAFLMTLQARY